MLALITHHSGWGFDFPVFGIVSDYYYKKLK
jgi:hypothetical protein